MQRQNFSSNMSIENPYEKKGLIRKTVCSDKVVATALTSTV